MRPVSDVAPHALRWSLAVAASLAALVAWALAAQAGLPSPVGADAPATRFSEARAKTHLAALVRLAPRTVGSALNEVEAPALVEGFAREVAAEAERAGTSRVKWDRQRGSGSFTMPDFIGGFASVYLDVRNVLVLVTPTRPRSLRTLMVSAHYDSAVGVSGASDNAANVANQMEVMRNLALDPDLRAPVLFVFNGAEETVLQGSHSLIKSGHPWLRPVFAFLNLEAVGTGGRELMFQTASRELLRAWAAAAPHPHGTVLATEVFQSGVIPGTTDYRHYVDLRGPGSLPGADFASTDSGHVYHTLLDEPRLISPGSQQRYGDNVLALARELLARADDDFGVGGASDHGLVVFFDVLGRGVVVLSGASLVPVLLLGGVAAVAPRLRAVPPTRAALADEARAVALGLALPALAGVVASWVAPLAYYEARWLVLPLFVAPASWGLVHARARGTPEPEALSAAVTVWGASFLALLALGSGACYVPLAWSACPALARTLAERRRPALAPWLGVALGSALPLVLVAPLVRLVLVMFVPLMGRAGLRAPGDVVVGALTGASVVALGLVPSTLVALLPPRDRARLQAILARAFLAGLAVAALETRLWPGGAFSPAYPKRVFAFHVARSFAHGERDDFVWLVGADSTGLGRVTAASGLAGREVDCDLPTRGPEAVYCDLPFYLPLKREIPRSLVLDHAPHPDLPWDGLARPCVVDLVDQETRGSRRVVRLSWRGWTDHASLFVRDDVLAWSMTADPLPYSDGHVFVLVGGVPDPAGGDAYAFTLEVAAAGGAPLRFAYACHYLEERSQALDDLVSRLPDWTTPVAFVTRWREALIRAPPSS